MLPCFLREEKEGKIRASLRSKNYADVDMLASMFGGGGHIRAAGFTIDLKGNFDTMAVDIAKSLENEFTRKYA